MPPAATALLKRLDFLPTRHPWPTVAAMLLINLAAFWLLLHADYSPETYQAAPADYDAVSWAWIYISWIAVVALLIGLRRRPDECRPLALASLVVTTASLIVLVKRWLGGPVQCLDPILFATACGWTTALWLRQSPSGVILNAVKDLCCSVRFLERLSRVCETRARKPFAWLRVTRPGGSQTNSNPSHPLQPVTLLTLGVCAATVGLFIYYMAQQIGCLNNLGLGYPDCGEPARLMYNTISNPRELFLRINPERLLFDDHFQPGIVPLVPLWLVWPDLKLLILLQVICALGPALPLYWIGKRLFQDKAAALLLVVAWLVYPSTSQFIYSGGFGFHWGNVCPLLYFVALAFWIHGRPGWALPIAVWAILIKEEACIPIGMFGVYVALFARRRLLGSVIAVAAFGCFLLITSVIVPAMSHQPFYMQRFFSDLGATQWEIFLSPWTKPRFFWGRLLSPSTFYFGALLLAPVLFIPLKKSSILLVGSLVFLFDCLPPMMLNSICYWYQAALLPVVFWALAAALQDTSTSAATRLIERVVGRGRPPGGPLFNDSTRPAVAPYPSNQERPATGRIRATLGGVVTAGLLLSIFFGNTFWSKSDWSRVMSPGRLPAVQRMARRIDPASSLFATPRVAAHFIKQKYLYTDPALRAPIDYVLLDLHDPILTLGVTRSFQYQVEARPEFHLVAAEDGLLLYARQGTPLDRRSFVERHALPPDAVRGEMNLESGITVVGCSVAPQTPEPGDGFDRVRVTIFSTIAVPYPANADLAGRCTLEFKEGAETTSSFASKVQFFGRSIWPISQWTTNQLYADDFLIHVPKGKPLNRYAVRFETVPTM